MNLAGSAILVSSFFPDFCKTSTAGVKHSSSTQHHTLTFPLCPSSTYTYVRKGFTHTQGLYYSTATNATDKFVGNCWKTGIQLDKLRQRLPWSQQRYFFFLSYRLLKNLQTVIPALCEVSKWPCNLDRGNTVPVNPMLEISCPNLNTFFCHVLSLWNSWHDVQCYFIPWVIISFKNGRRPLVLPLTLSVCRICTKHMVHGERKSC